MNEQPRERPSDRRDVPRPSSFIAHARSLIAAGIFTAVSVGGFLSLKGCDAGQEQVENHDRALKKDIADLYDEMVCTGDLPPEVRPEELTDDVRGLAIQGAYITMEGIFRREELHAQEVRAAYLFAIREHLQDGILAALDR